MNEYSKQSSINQKRADINHNFDLQELVL